MQQLPPIPGLLGSPVRPLARFPGTVSAQQARTFFYEYVPPKPANPETLLGWTLVGLAFLGAVFPVLGAGIYVTGVLLCIAALAIGCVVVSRGARHSGMALALAGLAAVPVGIYLAPWLANFFA